MNKIFSALALCLMLTAATAAQAFETPLKDPKDKAVLETVAKAMKVYAEDLGCSQFAWGNITSMGSVYQLQYIPTGTDANTWKQRVQITVYGLSGDVTKDVPMMMRLIAITVSGYERSGAKVLQKATYTDAKHEPLLFMEYESGDSVYTKPTQKEHGAGVLKRTSKNAASFILMQARGEKLTPNQVLDIHRMVNPKAK
jgi:hypothetical protein